MIRTAPLLHILRHSTSRLLINRDVIAPDTINLLPPFPASSLQCEFNIGEGLGDFGVEVGGDGDGGCVWVPAAWSVWLDGDRWIGRKEMGWSGRWRTLAGDFDHAAYFHGLLVVEGFLCPFSEVGIGGELRCCHDWKVGLGGECANNEICRGLGDLRNIVNSRCFLNRLSRGRAGTRAWFTFVIIEIMQLGGSALTNHFVLAPRAERALYCVYADLPSVGCGK